MKRTLLTGVLAALALAVFGLMPTASQDKPSEGADMEKPQVDPQKFLASLAGEFDAVRRIWQKPGAEPTGGKSTTSRKMVLGDTYLRESYEVTEGSFPHIGEITFCHNPRAGKIQFTHLISGFAGMRVLECDWDGAGKRMEFKYSDSMMWEGKKLSFNSRYVYTIDSADSQKLEIMTSYLDAEGKPGPEVKEIEIVYTRRK